MAVNLVLLFLAILIPKGNDVLFLNGMHSPFLDLFFSSITNLGNGLILIPILIWTLFHEFRLSIIVATAGALHGLLITILKRLVFPDMLRPAAILDNEFIHFVSGVNVHTSHSFPSGHTATIFLVTFLICNYIKNKIATVFLLVLATLVGFSRVYLAQHFLMDVAAGSMIGTLCAFLCLVMFDEHRNLPPWMSLRIHFRILKGRAATAK